MGCNTRLHFEVVVPRGAAGADSMLVVQQYALPPSEPGGTRQFELATIFRAAGWKVRIYASDFSHLEKRFFRRSSDRSRRTFDVVEQGVPFTYVWVPPYERNNWRRSLSMAWFSARAFFQVVACRERVIYASSPHLFGCFASFVAARLRRKAFVLEVRDLWPEHLAAVDPSMQGGRLFKLIGHLANILYARAELIVLFAEGSRAVVNGRGGSDDRIVVVTGVEVPEPVPHQPGPKGGPTRFVYLGSIGPMYGLDMVISACELLAESRTGQFSVTFIGNGPDKERLEGRAHAKGLEMVEFCAPVAKAEIYTTLADFDAGLLSFLPGEMFSFGISPQKMFDYMAVDLPIVSNVHGEVAATVEIANAGVTAKEQTSSSLAEAMEYCIDHAATLRDEFSGGRTYLTEHANRSAMVLSLVDRIALL
ncbi:MAG: glycosyltransferase family 4 protein [Actinomycetota bacterium]